MALRTGTRLGPYEIVAPIGAGGMGEVYKARDTKLGREVAIKVLPDAFAEHKERLARFEREARLLASLNHSNIATLFDLQKSDGVQFLVLEFVPGETLADRIKDGAIPADEALPLFKQIAHGLEAAHKKGVIHRDLKPTNIKVTPEGKVKVLDFGLAKALAGTVPAQGQSESPTLTRDGTEAGVLLGTAPYMSPEQARGKSLDKRTDIWSFGCVFYETLTGRTAFLGDTVSDTIAKILEREPEWEALPETTPPSIRKVIHRCLNKDPNRRLHDIADARIEIEEVLAEPAAELPAGEPSSLSRRTLPVILAVALLLAGAGLFWNVLRREPPVSRSLSHFVLNLEPGQELASGASPSIAISPDGTHVAYTAGNGADTRLYLHAENSFEAIPMPGTEGAQGPFFSPDGQWLGFYSKSKLFKVPVQGGRPEEICDASWGFPGASWGPDDTIVFGTPADGLWRCPASGGSTETLTRLDLNRGELRYGFPQFLPDGHSVLFTVDTEQGGRLAVLSLESGERRQLSELGDVENALYLRTGHLVYGRDGSLLAITFDLERLETEGQPTEILNTVYNERVTGFGVDHFALSENGTLVYVPGSSTDIVNEELVWVDRVGAVTTLSEERSQYFYPRLSPNGRSLAVSGGTGSGYDIWIYDVERRSHSRLTTRGDVNITPVWTPDGRNIAFASNRTGGFGIYWKSADGVGDIEPLSVPEPGQVHAPRDWSPDGTVLLFEQAEGDWSGGSDIWTLPVEGAREPKPHIATEFNEQTPRFSPDGRWIAYISDETGRFEVYVQSYTGPRGKWTISTDGGTEPVWSSDGRELFYRRGDQLMVVEISTEPSFTAGNPQSLFRGRFELGVMNIQNYDAAKDGQRFVMIQRSEEATPRQINVILNWSEELKRLVRPN